MGFIINAIKIIFLLGFLVLIHEGGHFIVARICKIIVNEFSIGFGPIIWKSKNTLTQYSLRLIPLGGYVSLEGENEKSDKDGSFSEASIPKKIAVVLAGGLVNIIFGIVIYFILILIKTNIQTALVNTREFFSSIFESLKLLFTGNVGMEQLMGPVGISDIVIKTNGISNYIYMLATISLSLGVTNLLPLPPLDGGKVIIYIIEWIRRKPLKEKAEIGIQMAGFAFLIGLSILVTYNDITRFFT